MSHPPGDEIRSLPPQSLVSVQPAPQPMSSVPSNQAGASPSFGPPTTMMVSGSKRYVMQLSGDLAMLMAVVWILSMAVMFYLGQHWHPAQAAGLAQGEAGHRGETGGDSSSTGVRRQGDYLLVLLTRTPDNAENQRFIQAKAKELNEIMERNAARGWKPYFALRKPIEGGVQLVFGCVDGQFGINKDEFIAFADLVAKPPSAGGAGYPDAKWLRVDGR